MRTFLPGIGSDYLKGLHWCIDLLALTDYTDLLFKLNAHCLSRNINAIFCSRLNIIIFHKINPGTLVSNNIAPVALADDGIDSS